MFYTLALVIFFNEIIALYIFCCCPPLIAVWFVVFFCGGVIVKSLRHQVQGQSVLVSRGFFNFGSFVLKPDFDLWLVKPEFLRQALSPLFCQVPIRLKLSF